MKSILLAALLVLTACAAPSPQVIGILVPVPVPAASAEMVSDVIILRGEHANPAVQTNAVGRALIIVDEDGAVSGVVEAVNVIDATAVIDDDAADAATPVVVTLVPLAEGRWEVPPDTRLTPEQIGHYKDGKLYATVRSKAYPKGELRAPLQATPEGGVRRHREIAALDRSP